ncbi:hypothetical protein J6590_070456 [Homalodisca vitripennis]|nr:hypothetical protein J6590_070456 [Homalodisca vitripennis]
MASSILLIPRHRTSTYNKSFVVTACRAWNSLPNHIKSVGSRNRFAALLKAKLLETMSAMVLGLILSLHKFTSEGHSRFQNVQGQTSRKRSQRPSTAQARRGGDRTGKIKEPDPTRFPSNNAIIHQVSLSHWALGMYSRVKVDCHPEEKLGGVGKHKKKLRQKHEVYHKRVFTKLNPESNEYEGFPLSLHNLSLAEIVLDIVVSRYSILLE